MKSLDWCPTGDVTLPVIFAADDLWFSHKTLSMLFAVTTQNISIHISDLMASGMHSEEREFLVAQKEGSRTIARRIKHFPFQIAHAIAMRSQRYKELNHLVDLAQQESLLKPSYKVAPIKERNFAALLVGALNRLEKVVSQYPVGSYTVDFFLPDSKIVVEYDEKHHKGPTHRERDQERQRYIEETLNARFVRVAQGSEVEGLNAVLRQIFTAKERI